jgi:hypothetical protein
MHQRNVATDPTIGSYYIQIKHSLFTAVMLVTDQDMAIWRVIDCAPGQAWPQEWRRGNSSIGGNGMLYCSASGVSVCRLSQVDFPPDLSNTQGFWVKQFFMEPAFADREGVQRGIVKTSPGHLTMPTHGSWMPFVTGPLIHAAQERLRAAHDELVRLAAQVGLDIAAMVDPTGALSVPAAAYALRSGDYLGCAMNLLGVIPLFGKVLDAAKFAKISARIAELTKEVSFLEKWIGESTAVGRRLRQTGSIENALKVEIQGATRATQLARAAGEVSGLLKNASWIQKIDSAERLGMLPEEIRVLRELAAQGYYFVIRSCNPSRVFWLRTAMARGWGMIAKPVWLKMKSLKGVKFAGLVGFAKGDSEYRKTIKDLKEATSLPDSFDLGWLAAKGMARKDVKVFQMTRGMNVPHVEDTARMLDHYWVDTGDAFVLVDRVGRPYVPDLDIVTIQRQLSRPGTFGPPGFNIGPANPVSAFRTADDAQFTAHWNEVFNRSIHYPRSYSPFGWHGGRGGSAAFIKAADKNFQPWKDVRGLGWNPEKPTEDLVVAVKGIDGLGDDVGFASGWDKLGAFQQANPGMGEWRFVVGK